ncbi:MAG: Ribonuclease HII [Mycoplasmataceae bacterium]|nr:MAG: Ribonuclease HII [Mycoplasmataceae bacterium]
MRNSLDFELELWKEYKIIAGLDEAGRGAIAGPLVVSGVILPLNFQNPLIQDSKKLSVSQREEAYSIILKEALEYKVVFKTVEEVERQNPLFATKEAMKEIILSFERKPEVSLIDGKEEVKIDNFKTISIISGDSKSINIAAASIISKVTRDEFMISLSNHYPNYHWDNNKGYPNKLHISALLKYGICDLHRKTYEPIKSLIKDNCNIKSIYDKYKIII